MGIFVITCFRPKPGKESLLLEAVTEHMPVLRKEGLVTDRECYVMKAKNGSIVEVFEWKSQEAINEAHKNESVLKLWKKFEESSDYVSYGTMEEAKQIFPGFEPLEL